MSHHCDTCDGDREVFKAGSMGSVLIPCPQCTTLAYVYERQQAASRARAEVSEAYENVFYDLHPRDRHRTIDHPIVVAAQKRADELALEVAGLREQAGGKVYRVNDAKLDGLRERIAKLNKKATKLGTDPITLTVSDEHDQTVRRIADEAGDVHEYIFDYTFVTVAGPTPMIEGFVFVATLDHEADQGADESVAIRRAPVGISLINQIGEQAAAAVETIDLSAYRHAGPDCDHCHTDRHRKQTYVLYEVATGKLVQLGTNCVKDFIPGANSPERVAAWAEWLHGLDHDLEYEGLDDFFEGGGGYGGRLAIPTLDFLANVAAVTREHGWTSRWSKSDYGEFERNENATADQALSNLYERNPRFRIKVTEADWAKATEALEWVREDVAERDDLDEFQHNLVTYTRANYLPEKGDGFIAYTIEARRREIEKALNAKRAGKSEWIGEPKQRVELTFHVTFTKVIDGYYGPKQLTKGHDDDGNLLVWWSSSEWLEQGKTYELKGTIKAHSTDDYQDGAKVTEITRVAAKSIREIEEVAA